MGQPNMLTGLCMNPAGSLMRAFPILTEVESRKLLDDLVLMIFFHIGCMLASEARIRDNQTTQGAYMDSRSSFSSSLCLYRCSPPPRHQSRLRY